MVIIDYSSGLALNASERRKPAACRCLFARPDPHQRWENRRRARAERDRGLDQMSQKYNFDFRTCTPMPGRLKWEKVISSNNAGSNPSGNIRVGLKEIENDSVINDLNINGTNNVISNSNKIEYIGEDIRNLREAVVNSCNSEKILIETQEIDSNETNIAVINTPSKTILNSHSIVVIKPPSASISVVQPSPCAVIESTLEEVELDSGISSDNSFLSTPGLGHSSPASISSHSLSFTSESSSTSLLDTPSLCSKPVAPHRNRSFDLQMTDFYPVCKRVRFSKQDDEKFL